MSIISITSSNGKTALIDEVDADLTRYNWYSLPNEYFCRRVYIPGRSSNKAFYLHREILTRIEGCELTRKEVTDHIDRNRFNNVRSNLRLASKAENAYNMKLPSHNTSGFLGICQVNRKYKLDVWVVDIKYMENGERKRRRLGTITGKINAAKTYDIGAAKLHGKFASFNFPEDWLWDDLQQCWLRVN